MAYTRTWDETFPEDTQRAADFGAFVRQTKTDLRERIASFGAGPLADRPTPDDEFGNANFGVVYFAIDTGQIFRWNASSWVDVTANLSTYKLYNTNPVVAVDAAIGNGQQVIIPAGFLQVGDVIKVISHSYHSVGAKNDSTVTVSFGPVAYAGAFVGNIQNAAGGLNAIQHIEAIGSVAAIGAAGAGIFYANINFPLTSQNFSYRNAWAGVNTTVPLIISSWMSGGAVGNSWTFEQLLVEITRL